MHTRIPYGARWAPASLALALAATGCASLPPTNLPDAGPPDGLRPLITRDAALNQPATTTPADDAIPLGREEALRRALIDSPRLQAAYASHDIALAERLQAGLPANPSLGFGRLGGDGPAPQITRLLGLPLADWLLQPSRKRLAEAEFQAARREIAAAIVETLRDVEAAWYEAVAAAQVAELRGAHADATAAASELARRFFDAGNIGELQLRREQAAASEARIVHAQARAAALKARSTLARRVGLPTDAPLRLPTRLPLPVAREDRLEDLLASAMTQRLDLQAATLHAEAQRAAADTQRRWRGLGAAGIEIEREDDGVERKRGATLELELPLFDRGQGRIAKADAHWQAARIDAEGLRKDIEASVRLQAAAVQVARELVAIHREALLPQREAIVARQQERQNYMLVGVFELIESRRQEFDAYQSYLEAIRDYWLARNELARAVGTTLPSDSMIDTETTPVRDWLQPTPASGHEGMDHSRHGLDHSYHGPTAPATGSPPHRHLPAEPEKARPAPHGEPSPKPAQDEADDASHDHSHHDHGGQP